MFERYPSILVTKLYIPRLRSSHISRNALIAALDSGTNRKLILIAAAAGFGKTTLMADWSSQHTEHVCWLSLDEGDNDPTRVLSYIVAAFQTHHPELGQELLAALQSPQPPTTDNAVHVLINQLAAVPDRIILVLDDYHVIHNQVIHEAVTFFLDHLPPQVTLAVLTRSDPPFSLARLRASNDLLELRAASLQFSVAEATEFLNDIMQLDLPETAIRALDKRTEGWIVGLQLAGIAMQSLRDNKGRFVENFTGSHHFILDYLITEVLSQQREPIRRFLLHTAILRQLSSSLCAAVTGIDDAQDMLETLERNNLFLIPLDQSRQWYRYHHLFADLLLARLQAEEPMRIKDLRRRAAHWYHDYNMAEEAVSYALEAEDYEFAANLITGPAAGVTQRGEVGTLLTWYRAFPPDFVTQQPLLSLYFGLAFALSGRWTEAEALLTVMERHLAGAAWPGEALLFAYLVANFQHDTSKLEQIAAMAATEVQPDALTKLVLALLESLWGDWQKACRLMAEAQEASERSGDLSLSMTALFHRTRLNVLAGNLREGYALCREVLNRIREMGSPALPMATFAHSSLGRILIEWNELDEAAVQLTEAIRLAELSGFVTGTVSSGTIMLAEVRQAQGNHEGASDTAQAAIAKAERYDPQPEVEWLRAYQVRIWLSQGNIAAAADWARRSQPERATSIFYPTSIQKVALARTWLAQRKVDDAVALLTDLLKGSQDILTVEALGVLALARQAQGDSVHAIGALTQALAIAESENRIRMFVDLGVPMAKLLNRFCENNPNHKFAHQILDAFPEQPINHQAVEPLSDREIEVLRLIVAGQSNEEIASTLTIALSTVKWYINILYGKLHVKTRSQAIARTHTLHLLDS